MVIAASSLWAATAEPAPATVPLAGEIRADVAVVGGGFCGLSCALHLAEAGVDTVLLEAQEPGWGASGRNGGQVIPCFKDDPETLIARLGEDLGERMSRLGAEAGTLVENLIARHNIACAYRRNGWILGIAGMRGIPAMESRTRQWQARGLPVRLLDREETAALIGAPIYAAGYLDPRGGALNPLSFARGLAAAGMRQGARIHTGSPVIAITREGSSWRVATASGAVLASQVVVATGAYSTDLIPALRRSILPVQSIQIATPPMPAEIQRTILPQGHVVSDNRRLLLYFRFNEQGRFVFGGRGSLGGESIAEAHVTALAETMRRSFPQLGQIGFQHVWAGQVDITPGRRLRVHEPSPGLIAVFGFSGRGVAIAPAVGKAIAEAVLAGTHKGLPLPVTPMRPVPFHGLRLPAMAVAAQWFRLLDRLEAR
ncbi:NAD(P)/FAD-dependent oxidoreductase [Rhodoligotrophos defluvii]|uniref:NAD(P)/FAD-dependent oxidoreductase n=1 Tax=Rhodoligotrophos defluvii TaxID=2561934 RepID=UPI0010C9EA5F|nr:FAD-binding oxidoreductase [Rhodoligotrophos defluvii]